MDFQSYVSYGKDISSITFAIVGSIIAVLTYRKAKETILQPVRTEVIKRQADILIEMLPYFEPERFNADLDYRELARVNAGQFLLTYGAIFASENVKSELKKIIVASRLYADKDGKLNVERIEAFQTKEQKKNSDDKKLYEEAKRGNIFIDAVHVTQKHLDCVGRIKRYAENPFVPADVIKCLSILQEEVEENLSVHLRGVVAWVINEVIQRENKAVLSYDGIFNEFNSKRLHHEKILSELRSSIRKYLRIDSTPW